MTNRIFVSGDTVTVHDLDLLPAGAQVERADDGWKVTSVPEVQTVREALAWELYSTFNPDTMLTGLSHGWTADKWRELADYVSANFTRKQDLPDEVTDGDGDGWYFKSNGLYGSLYSDVGSRTLEEIRDRWGIPSEVTPAPRKLRDRDGDTWEIQSDGTYRVRYFDGELSEVYQDYSEQQVRDQFAPVTVVTGS